MKETSQNNSSSSAGVSQWIRRLAWLNIAVQVAFPLTLAFSPAVTAAKSNKPPVIKDSDQQLRTRPYTLIKGETVASVAKKYNMTVAELRKLNQLRTFARGFDHLQAGDELDVPLAPQTEENKRLTSANPPSRTIQSNDTYSAQHQEGAAGGMARNMATGAASNEIQQWLSQFGTARVQLDANEKFSLKNSQLELLAPLYDKEKGLAFTQGSIHRTNDRNQANLGVGYRYFDSDWMVGGNLFADYDLSRDHARTGAGVEYWRDFMKLSANGYLRLTNWKDSPDLDDYRERPANGWDVRAQGWLPALPQLGGKLTYEQYYGKNVGLFGSDHLRHNPHAITAGINYTPIPLVTLNAERRQGESGTNDNRLGIEFNYRLGTDWKNQIDPSAVAAMHTLAGSRYDLVDRNNNIVLEYKKKETIHLRTVNQITGRAGESKSLGVSVTSKHGLAKVEWQAAELLASGGQIIRNGDNYDVILPPWKVGGNNTYSISGEAVDTKGNRSARSYTQITVLASIPSQLTSRLVTDAPTLVANGTDSRKVTLTVKDSNGTPLSGLKVRMSSSINGSTFSAVSDNGDGTYTADLTSVQAGVTTITAQIANSFTLTTTVNLLPDAATATVSTLNIIANDAVADGVAMNKVKATVKDAHGRRLEGQTVTFSATNSATVNPMTVVTNANGEASTILTSLVAGSSTVTATSNGTNQTTTVNFSADNATAHISAMSVTADDAIADGSATNTVKATVTDANGNPLVGHAVTFSATNGATVVTTIVTTNADGEARTSLTSHNAGSSMVTAALSNGSSSTATVNFSADNTTAMVRTLKVTSDEAVADGSAENAVTAKVTDARGNPLVGHAVTFSADNGAIINITTVTTNAHGEASTTLTSHSVGSSTVTATSNGHSQSTTVHFIADSATARVSLLDVVLDNAVADGLAHNIVKAKITDAYGNPLPGHYAVFFTTTSSGIVIDQTTVTTDANGEATTTLTSHTAGSGTITASCNGTRQDVTVNFTPHVIAWMTAIQVMKNNAIADGIDTNEVRVFVQDRNNNLLPGQTVIFRATNGATLSSTTATTGADGYAYATLTSYTAGSTEVFAVDSSGNEMSYVLNFKPNQRTALAVVKDNAIANNSDTNEIKATVTDAQGNPLAGHLVTFSATNGAQVVASPVATNANGEAVAKLYSATYGNSTVTATVNGLSETTTVKFDPVVVLSNFTLSRDNIEVNELTSVDVLVSDLAGNPVAGQPVSFSSNYDASFSSQNVVSDSTGHARVQVNSTKAAVHTITASTRTSVLTGSLTITAHTYSARIASIVVVGDNALADGIDASTLQIKVTDRYDNPVKDQTVTFSHAPDLVLSNTSVTTDANGIASIQMTSTTAGSHLIIIRCNRDDQWTYVNFR